MKKQSRALWDTLADGTAYTDVVDGEDMKACLFSEGQLVFSGKGRLDIDANCKAGVRSDDYVRFMPGGINHTGSDGGRCVMPLAASNSGVDTSI